MFFLILFQYLESITFQVTRVIHHPQRRHEHHVSVCRQSKSSGLVPRGLIGWTELELQLRCELIGLEAAPLCETIGRTATRSSSATDLTEVLKEGTVDFSIKTKTRHIRQIELKLNWAEMNMVPLCLSHQWAWTMNQIWARAFKKGGLTTCC